MLSPVTVVTRDCFHTAGVFFCPNHSCLHCQAPSALTRLHQAATHTPTSVATLVLKKKPKDCITFGPTTQCLHELLVLNTRLTMCVSTQRKYGLTFQAQLLISEFLLDLKELNTDLYLPTSCMADQSVWPK